ncbi:MAG TPA: hypothetical protein DCM28_01005, partial [Phycisphaerales bacterium]|nr:hypothetical protein [Phycisphaerales bacterium]
MPWQQALKSVLNFSTVSSPTSKHCPGKPQAPSSCKSFSSPSNSKKPTSIALKSRVWPMQSQGVFTSCVLNKVVPTSPTTANASNSATTISFCKSPIPMAALNHSMASFKNRSRNMKAIKQPAGFTLIELLVVIS